MSRIHLLAPIRCPECGKLTLNAEYNEDDVIVSFTCSSCREYVKPATPDPEFKEGALPDGQAYQRCCDSSRGE